MIYKLKQNRVSRTYHGGKNIDAFTGEHFLKKGCYPEDWTASATFVKTPGGATEGIGVSLDGSTITDIIGSDTLPILVKLLDSDERLVVQVHPTVEFAAENLNSQFGKTECWYFLSCADDACVYLGFKLGITKELWRETILSGDSAEILSLLHRVPVKQGDFVFVNGGVPHAIGSGCFMIELQEPSDLMVVAETKTVTGNPMPKYRIDMGLGMDKALDMYDYTGCTFDEIKEKYLSSPAAECNAITEICSERQTDKFSMSMACGNTAYKCGRKYAVVIVTSGAGELNNTAVKRGDRLFCAGEEKLVFCGGEDFNVIICE